MIGPAREFDLDQLDQDVYDVFCARTKKITDFPLEYREKLRDAYRFSGVRRSTRYRGDVMITNDTRDLV
jgi:hypothetical protein